MSHPSNDPQKGELFLFEDIMREYGHPTPQAEPAPKQEPMEPPVDESPVTEAPVEAPPEPVDPTPHFEIIVKDLSKPKKTAHGETVPTPAKAEKTVKPKVISLHTSGEEPVASAPTAPAESLPQLEPTAQEESISLQTALKQVGSGGTLRTSVLGLFALVAAALTVAHGLEQPMGSLSDNPQLLPIILLGMLLLSTCLALDVMKDGIFHLISGKIRLDGLLSITVVVLIVHGFFAVNGATLPYATVGILGLSYGLSAKSFENRSKKRIYRGLISLRESPSAIVVSPNAYEGASGVHKLDGFAEDVVNPVETDSKPQKILGIYGLVAFALSMVVSLGVSFWKGDNFLPIWAAILSGSLPVYGMVSFWKPFWKGTNQLTKNATVLCGWSGVQAMGKRPKVITTEQDLFTGNQVSVNGMKVYPEFEVRQVVGYVCAVIRAGGGGLATVFETLYQQQNGLEYTTGQFKRYDNGGLGAEIQADVVLVGSLGFMKLMGVKMPEGANLRQAVYCSVNGYLAGVFALHYLPSAMAKNAMHSYIRSGGVGLILATKDFILSPAAIRHYYKIPTGWMEFPTAQERANLADSRIAPGTTAGLMARSNFAAVLECARVGQQVYNQSMIGLSLSMVWGICGLLLTSGVAILGAYSVASPFNVTIFSLLWTFAAWVLSSFHRK